jgi:DNA-binding XRE family transcriptional regulator
MAEKSDPSLELAVEIFKVLKTRPNADVKDIMASVSLVLTTIAVETGMEEEKAVYAFTKSFRSSKSRLKNLVRQVH